MIKYNITKNEERNSVTLVVTDVEFYSAKYLLEKFQDKRFFGNGVIKKAGQIIKEIIGKLVVELNSFNNLPKEAKVKASNIFREVGYTLFTAHQFDFEEKWNKENFQINLTTKKNKNLFYDALKNGNPITTESEIKKYLFAVEVELNAYYDEDEMETKVFSIFHRAIINGIKQVKETQNDDAWAGIITDDEFVPW